MPPRRSGMCAVRQIAQDINTVTVTHRDHLTFTTAADDADTSSCGVKSVPSYWCEALVSGWGPGRETRATLHPGGGGRKTEHKLLPSSDPASAH